MSTFFPYRDTEIVNDALIIKKKIWSESDSVLYNTLCPNEQPHSCGPCPSHWISSIYKNHWANLCLIITKHQASVSQHRLRHKAITMTRSTHNPVYHTLNRQGREINNLYPACTVKHWRHRAQQWGNFTWKHTRGKKACRGVSEMSLEGLFCNRTCCSE